MNSKREVSTQNPLGLEGICFVEFVSPAPETLEKLFTDFGFSKTYHHPQANIDLFQQNEINFMLNRGQDSEAARFKKTHGPSISAMGWLFWDAARAFELAIARGARPFFGTGSLTSAGRPVPAIYGIGVSLIYFLDQHESARWKNLGFREVAHAHTVPDKGFTRIDHLTNNVAHGTMKQWADFYKTIFGFTEVRYFDIRGVQTGLTSYALRSPCGSFCIPINEAGDEKSQINEYLREYNGPGIQHLAFLTNDIVASLDAMKESKIETLDIDDDYYAEVFTRIRQVTEDKETLKKHKILIDGDDKGYLLQIFTKNLVGPIFIEIIQRKNHLSFGEGNFAALFRSIERDQEKRGVFA